MKNSNDTPGIVNRTTLPDVCYHFNCLTCARVISLKCPAMVPVVTVLKWLTEEHESVLLGNGKPCSVRITTFTVDFNSEKGAPS